MLISLSGAKQSGKDTTARIIQWYTAKHPYNVKIQDFVKGHWLVNSQNSTFQIKKWAYKLKQVASLYLNIPVEDFEKEEVKNSYLPECWSKWKLVYYNEHDTVVTEYFDSKEDAKEWLAYWGEYDIEELEYAPITVRQFLEWLGTEGMRDGVHQNIHVNGLMSDYVPHIENYPNLIKSNNQPLIENKEYSMGKAVYPKWIISDTRFFNELEAVKAKDGICVRIHNAKAEKAEKSSHKSANEWKSWDFDYEIDNNGTIKDLIVQVDKMLNHFNLI